MPIAYTFKHARSMCMAASCHTLTRENHADPPVLQTKYIEGPIDTHTLSRLLIFTSQSSE